MAAQVSKIAQTDDKGCAADAERRAGGGRRGRCSPRNR